MFFQFKKTKVRTVDNKSAITEMENTQKGNHVVNNEAKWQKVPVTRKTPDQYIQKNY